MKSGYKRVFFFLFILAILIIWGYPAFATNKNSVQYLRSMNGSSLPTPIANPTCSQLWLQAVSSQRVEQPQELEKILYCGETYLSLLTIIRPFDSDLALQAVKRYPTKLIAWNWLGEASDADGELQTARQAYEKIIEIDPNAAIAWCKLGRLDANAGHLDLAAKEFLSCCKLGDPGRNGCYGAGMMYEKLGDFTSAIAAYRLSTWSPAYQRADDLEKKLVP